MSLVDANNNASPLKSPGTWGVPTTIPEYTPTCHRVRFQGVKPNNATVAMQNNSGNVYIMYGSSNNFAGNKNDTGQMIAVITPGNIVELAAMESDGPTISPYQFWLDADTNNDGAIVCLLNNARG
jgi:hypothetical protein